MHIRPTRATLGVIISNIDVRALSVDAFGELEAVWHEHAVLIFPAQQPRQRGARLLQPPLRPSQNACRRQRSQAPIPKSSWRRMSGTTAASIRSAARFLHNKGNRIWHSDSSFKSNSAKAPLLCAEACRGDRVYRHRWHVGDVAIWDNRCVLHRGLPYPVNQRRIMCRTTVAGDQSGNEWVLSAARDNENKEKGT